MFKGDLVKRKFLFHLYVHFHTASSFRWDLLFRMALIFQCYKDSVLDKEPFPFFDLPDVVILKILKEYLPVTDKAGALSQIETFQPYLSLNSVWHQPSLNLYHLVGGIEPGWYVDRRSLPNRYHFSIDYVHLTCTISSFCTELTGSRQLEDFNAGILSLSNERRILETFQEFNLTRIQEKNILVYRYEREHFENVCFWIFVKENIVCCLTQCNQYSLKDNECVIPKNVGFHNHDITLILQKDGIVLLKCRDGGKCHTIQLAPLTFQLCDTLPAPHRKMSCSREIPNSLHAASTVTFSDFDDEDAYMMVRHFETNYMLVKYNVISLLCLKKDDDSRAHTRMWTRKFRRPRSQICDLFKQCM